MRKLTHLIVMCLACVLAIGAAPVAAADNSTPIGHHDVYEGEAGPDRCGAGGWAVDPDDPYADLDIRVLVDGVQVATGVADLFRQDLLDAGVSPDGYSAFAINLWDLISHNVAHEVLVQAHDAQTDEWVALAGTPKSLTCSALPIGFHDGVEGVARPYSCAAFGWAVDPDDPYADLNVRILADGVQVATGVADLFRQDLLDAGVSPDGYSAFSISLLGALDFDVTYSITAQAQDVQTGEWVDLNNTPKDLTCEASDSGDVVHITTVCSVGWDDGPDAAAATDPSCDVLNVRTGDGDYVEILHGQIPDELMQAFRDAGSPRAYHTGCAANYGFWRVAKDEGADLPPFVFSSSVRHFTPEGQMTEFCSTAPDRVTPTHGSSGYGSGGVFDNQTLILFGFSFNNDELQVDVAAWSPVDEEPDPLPTPTCSYSGNTAEDGGLSWSDSGTSLVIRLDGVTTTCGTATAELEVNYRDSDLETTAIVDNACDGGLRRGVLRSSDNTAVASVYIENAYGDPIFDATGDGGSGSYESEQYVCVDPGP